MGKKSNSLTVADGNAANSRFEIPAELLETLTAGTLTTFEDKSAYDQLVQQFASAVQPRDTIDWMWVLDVANCTWEINRARRAKSAVLSFARKRAIRMIVADERDRGTDPLGSIFDNDLLKATMIVEGNHNDIAEFEAMLDRIGLTKQSVVDLAYNNCLSSIERLDRIVDTHAARRDTSLRELDRRRDAMARRMRFAIEEADKIVDAEFEE